MNKMNNDEYLKRMERQFGDCYPDNSAPCKYCKLPYGKHYGFECPKPEDIEPTTKM